MGNQADEPVHMGGGGGDNGGAATGAVAATGEGGGDVQLQVLPVDGDAACADVEPPPATCCGRLRQRLPCCRKGKKPKKKEVGLIKLYMLLPSEYWRIALGTLGGIANGATLPAFSIIFGGIFQVFYDSTDIKHDILKYTFLFLGVGVAAMIVSFLQVACFAVAGEHVTAKIRKMLFEALLYKDVAFFDGHMSGELTSRLASDMTNIQNAVSEKVGSWIQYMSQVLTGIVIAFIYGWKLTLVLLSISPAIVICFAVFNKLLEGSANVGQDSYAAANGIASEVITGFRTVISFVREKYENNRFIASLHPSIAQGHKRAVIAGLGVGITNLFMFGTYALGYWYGGTLIADNEMSVGDVLTVFFAVVIGAMGLGQAGSLNTDFAKGRAAATTIFDYIKTPSHIDKNLENGVRDTTLTGQVQLRDVQFRYPARPERQILKGLSLDVLPGKTTALVGASGGGKSTVLQLIERFYDPEAGQLMIDGVELKDYNLDWIRSQIALVAQEPILFGGSVAENIRYGKLDATDEEVEQAAKVANAHDFITKLPQQYGTLVGEKGTQLSGGQKQRVAIARAVLKDPKILLLDEATSALDSESEQLVQQALDNLMQGRTTIVIAHRLSTIRDANQIAVIENGLIAELGCHSELLEKKGVYYGLVYRQTFIEYSNAKVAEKEEQVQQPENENDTEIEVVVSNSGDAVEDEDSLSD